MRRVGYDKPAPQRPLCATFCLVWCPARPPSPTTQQRSEHVGHLKYALYVPFPAIPPVVSGKVAQTAHPQRARRVVLMSIVGKLYLFDYEGCSSTVIGTESGFCLLAAPCELGAAVSIDQFDLFFNFV